MKKFEHVPVMLKEAIEGLNIQKNGIYVDATVGGAGHSKAIIDKLDFGMLYCFDRDKEACYEAALRLKGKRAVIINDNYSNLKGRLKEFGVDKVDGILFDLGVSSHQLESESRGFSYLRDTQLDMRMGKNQIDACYVVNRYDKERLKEIFYRYGEERYAKSIADSIVRARDKKTIETTFELNESIKAGMPSKARRDKHPCKRVYQAIRIEVNGELSNLKKGLDDAFEILGDGKRLVVISFHSLEDRIVKQKFKSLSQGCLCPPSFPICVCNNKPKARIIGKMQRPSEEEKKANKKSRSATLRVLEKIGKKGEI